MRHLSVAVYGTADLYSRDLCLNLFPCVKQVSRTTEICCYHQAMRLRDTEGIFNFYILEPAKIGIAGPQVLKLHRGEKNITVECFGRGKPRPTITWKKNGTEILKTANETRSNVVQILSKSSDIWNVSSVLYLRLAGVTYDEAGNYTCELYNGVDQNKTVESSISVLCK